MAEHHAPSRPGKSHLDGLARSSIYREYQRAFTGGTGLPLALHASEMLGLVRYPKGRDNPFCRLMAGNRQSCAACYALQQNLERAARRTARTLECFAGLVESAVPVRVGNQSVGFLHTGHVLLQPPSNGQVNRLADRLRKWGAAVRPESVEAAYFQTRVIPPAQYNAMVGLLALFAQQLAAGAQALLFQTKAVEPVAIHRARQFIQANHAGELSLGRVARAVNISATYLSQQFKQATGLTFVDYVARVRVETAKDLLRQRRLKISAVALEAGFRSLSQFNRTFRKVAGQSPRQHRDG